MHQTGHGTFRKCFSWFDVIAAVIRVNVTHLEQIKKQKIKKY